MRHPIETVKFGKVYNRIKEVSPEFADAASRGLKRSNYFNDGYEL